MDEPARTLLGHHELQGARSMAVYSRDMLTRPLQLYCSMLKNIRGDHFRPDESRTSRMLDLMKIRQGETTGKDADAALITVASAKDCRMETDDDAAPTTPLEDAALSAKGSKRQGGDESENDSDSLASTSSSSSDTDEDNAPEAARRDY